MRLRYDQPTIEEYQELCFEEKRLVEMATILERFGEFDEAIAVRAEFIFIGIKKTCYKAALKQKRKAAAAGTAQTAC